MYKATQLCAYHAINKRTCSRCNFNFEGCKMARILDIILWCVSLTTTVSLFPCIGHLILLDIA